jgi:hypothetical protein
MKPLSLFVSFYLHFFALSVPLQLSELRFQVDLDASQGLEARHEQQQQRQQTEGRGSLRIAAPLRMGLQCCSFPTA